MAILALIPAIVIWGLIFWVLWWGLDQIALPEPFNKIAFVVLIIAIVYVAIKLLSLIAPYALLV